MPIFGNRIENLLDQLQREIPHVDEGIKFFGNVERSDWRPVWALCREIQTEFKGFKGFETREEHQAAWNRFQDLRKRASRLSDIEKQKFADQSAQLKRDILYDANGAYWSMSADTFVGAFLGHTTVEDMQGLQLRLKSAGRRLSENKALMTKSDKEECFEAIKRSRDSHDQFWEKYKGYRAERRKEQEQRNQEFERKRAAWRERTNAKIARNREKLSRAENALERTRDRIREIKEKLYDTDSDKWRGIFSEWLSEAQDKERDIEGSIDRIRGWISEDEDKISSS